MSTPIADTAGYFANRRAHYVHSASTPEHSSDGRPQDENSQVHRTPQSRHPHVSHVAPSRSSNLEPPTRHSSQQDSSSLLDPRAQWNRVLGRLSFFGGDSNHDISSQAQSVRHGHDEFLDEEEDEAVDRDTFELIRNKAENRLRHHSVRSSNYQPVREQEDDVLPSTYELKHEHDDVSAAPDNYFVHPFMSSSERMEAEEDGTVDSDPFRGRMTKISVQAAPVLASAPLAAPQAPGATPSEEEDRAKHQWGKTLDKIRLIANIQTGQTNPRLGDVIPNTALAPYYPPAFEAPFIALSTDEHGRKLPPILMQCISVAVTDSEFLSNGVNQWVFRIELQYGDVKWVIRRTIADFVRLHYGLMLKSSLSDYVAAPPSFPNQLESLFNSAKTTIGWDRAEEEDEADKEKQELALNRRRALTTYLRELLKRAHMMVSYDVCEFLELSANSIAQDMGWKGKEGYLENKVNFVNPRLCSVWKPKVWNTEWVIIRDSYLAFCENIASTEPTDVFLFDKSLKVTTCEPNLLGACHITLENKFRRIEIKGSKREVDEWLESIRKVQSESPWVKNHRFGSFAPIRHSAKVKWFVDGENHFNAVAEAILSAKSEIYIADWWLTPELYLRRPPEQNEEFRIDRLLQRKAREGVMIYIIVYKEMSVALTINSAHTKQWLQNLHPNILVQRHPDHKIIENDVLFWSHHEKIVVVDNRLAFIGGLDLCFGRYDTHSHRMADHPADGHDYLIFPGQDYSNPRAKDFVNVIQHDLTLVDRSAVGRMPWHDVTLGVVGPIARDISRHFIQRWNFIKASKSMHRPVLPFLTPKGEYVAARDESKFTGTCRVQLMRSSSQWSSGIEREHSIYNAYMECITQAKHFIYIENQFFISATDQDKILRNKIAQAMVERIKLAHDRKEKFKIFIVIPLVPAFQGDLASSDSSSARAVMHFQYISISRGGNSIFEKLKEAGIDDPSEYIGFYSLRKWDKIAPRKDDKGTEENKDKVGEDEDEPNEEIKSPFDDENAAAASNESLPDGLSEEQSTAEEEEDDRDHYVSEILYIHDKLMIVDDRIVLIGSANINDRSMLGNRDSEVAMLIEDTEMVPSYMDGKQYKAAKFAHTLRMQLWKEHLGLLDFENWEDLMRNDEEHPGAFVDSLRVFDPTHQHCNHDMKNDDIRYCESAEPVRILDRTSRTRSLYDTFKLHMRHHAKREDAAALDPLSDRGYYKIWRKTAETNTVAFRELFHCVPDDTVHTFEKHRQFVPDPTKVKHGHVADPEMSGEEIRRQLKTIRGHLVLFPTDYLKDENVMGTSLIETVTPPIIFT
ncbi:Phospholipase D1 [Apophysomyces ossiformis]|uniref:Phospholipase n=1 Tax=Apophysomyces ossiformis TaxID=679940 RepID=A0A8H7BMB0_9FUNG|nr:Phospholipase D1 [Apophysomyces ossiformis]